MNKELQEALDKLRAMKESCHDDPQLMLNKYGKLVEKLEVIVPKILKTCNDTEKDQLLTFIRALKSDCVELVCRI